MSREDFRRLQLAWYQKLSERGFKDIEKFQGDDLVLMQTASHCYRATDAFSREMKEEYFRCMAQAARDEETVFRNGTDKYILLRHSEGAKIKAIREELIAQGVSRERDSIRYIIRRYEAAWGFRSYAPQELHLKKKA